MNIVFQKILEGQQNYLPPPLSPIFHYFKILLFVFCFRKQKLPQGKNKVLHSFMMGSSTKLSPQEAIEVFFSMEEELLVLARERKFEGVFTTNTNALTQVKII